MLKTRETPTRNLKLKISADLVTKWITFCAAAFLVIIFLGLIGFIIWKSVPGFQHYGFSNIILSSKFNINDNNSKEASVWLPLSITLLISFFAVLIATPIAVKTATFIKFRIRSKKLARSLRIIVETSAGIPSVIFGLFAAQSLGTAVAYVFHLNSNFTILTAIFMLSFMLIPTITALTLNAYDSNDMLLINNSVSLGITKTRSIYKIFRKQTRQNIFVAIIIALGRAIGETMAVSMILSSQSYQSTFNEGFGHVLSSSLSPLGAVISVGMFSENGGTSLRGLLYAFGIVMFVVVMILNGFVLIITNKRKKHTNYRFALFETKIKSILAFVPNQFSILFERITYKSPIQLTPNNVEQDLSKYVSRRIQNDKFLYGYSAYKLFWEIICSLILFSFIGWIVLDIIINGIHAASLPSSTMFKYGMNTTGEAALNTLLLIFITIIITLPLAILIAIYLNEFAKDRWPKKLMLFFMDSLGATPSIIFGMFGLAFFIQTIGISMSGRMGTSLLAGALTVAIVILPNFVRTIQTALENVPLTLRENSYALGNGKWETIYKLVLPAASKGIVTATLLAIGRILAETAPLYLTAGLSSASSVAIMNPGQTLTTRIYAQLYATNATTGMNIMYESALTTLILVLVLTIIGHLIIPNLKLFKKESQYYLNTLIYTYLIPKNYSENIIQDQIQKNILYLNEQQAHKIKLVNKQKAAFYYKHHRYEIKVVANLNDVLKIPSQN